MATCGRSRRPKAAVPTTARASREPAPLAALPELGTARCYSLYGLTIDSPVHLEAPPCSPRTRPDVRLREGTPSRFETLRRRHHITPLPRDWFEATLLGNGSTYLRWAR